MAVKVECESCKAPYSIDERRIPASGLRVRCPKCAKTFVIRKPGGAAPTAAAGSPPIAPPPSTKTTTGFGDPDATAEGATDEVGLPAPVMQRPSPRRPAATIAFSGAPGAIPQPIAFGAPLPATSQLGPPPPAPSPPGESMAKLPALPPQAMASSLPPPKEEQTLRRSSAPDDAAWDDLPAPVDAAAALPAIPVARAAASPRATGATKPETPRAASPQAAAPIAPAQPAAAAAARVAPRPFIKGTQLGLGTLAAKLTSGVAAGTGAPKPPNADDFPAVRGASPAAKTMDAGDLPAMRGAPPAGKPIDADLPANRAAKPAAASALNEGDLPATRGGNVGETARGVKSLGEIDFPSPVARPGPAPRPKLPKATDMALPLPAGVRGGDPSVDLPALSGGMSGGMSGGKGADLPSRKQAGGATTPAVRAQKAGGAELDLPSVPGAGRDLPATRGGFGELDLPSVSHGASGGRDLPATKGGFGELDLPAPAPIGLPAVSGRGVADLPMPQPIGLPSVSGRGADLPELAPAGAHLPSVAGSARAKDSPFGDVDPFGPDQPRDLGVARTQAGPQQGGGGGGFGEIELPGPSNDPFAHATAAGGQNAFGELDLGGGASAGAHGAADFGDLELPGPSPTGDAGGVDAAQGTRERAPNRRPPSLMIAASRPPPAPDDAHAGPSTVDPASLASLHDDVRTGAGGGMGFGEVDLGGGESPSADDDMEFGAIPQENKAGTPADERTEASPQNQFDEAPLARAKGAPAERAPAVVKRGGNVGKVFLGLFAALLIGGAALEFTPYGAFARNYIADRLNAPKYASATDAAITRTRAAFASDSIDVATTALQQLDSDVGASPRYSALLAYAAYANYAHEIRFGKDAAKEERARSLLSGVIDPANGNQALATAARDVVAGQYGNARTALKTILTSDTKNIDAAVTLGELELRDAKPKDAVAAFQSAKVVEDSARTSSGLMRAYAANGQVDKAKAEAAALSKKFPAHAPSRLLLAHYAWEQDRDEKGALGLLDQVTKPPVSNTTTWMEKVDAGTLRGDIQFERGRVSEAAAAYSAAIAAANGNPSPMAKLGLGEVSMANGQYGDAIANFKSAAEQDPTLTQAKIGIARAQLKQENAGDAKLTLTPLKDPKFAGEIGYWLGQAEEKLSPEKPMDAMRIYQQAIKAQPTAVMPYIALANLQAKTGSPQDADATLKQAVQAVPKSDKLHLAIGRLKFGQEQYADALKELDTALDLQPDNLEALYEKGRTLIRMSKDDVEKGKVVLDQVEAKDPKYPGLGLEMGLYYQKTNQLDLALKRYEAALAAAPDDADVQLSVARAMVESHNPEAEARLRDVLEKCPNKSASPDVCITEANHYLGRALLDKGAVDDALPRLKQAVDKSDTNAAYHLYYGWALLKRDHLEDAEREADLAIEHDKARGDAYWLRAEILTKQTRYREGIQQASLALEYTPSLQAAHGTIAECDYQLGLEDAAIAEYRRALDAVPSDPDAPTWRYRIADILAHRGEVAKAVDDLREAIKIASALDNPPHWLPKAYYYLGEATKFKDKEESKRAFRTYLEKSVGSSDPAREDARGSLIELGAPYVGP